jgi:hypothetical protein
MRGRKLPILALVLGLLPLAGQAQEGEFVVSADHGYKRYPAAAMDRRGEVLVAWQESLAVFGQRYAADGAPRGGNFEVGSNAQNYRGPVSAAIDPRGFSVVWEEEGQFSGLYSYFRRFDVQGRELATRFLGQEGAGSVVASDPRGVSVVVTPDGEGLLAARYDAAGRYVGSPFRVVHYPTREAQVAVDATGAFVVVWSTPQGIFGRRYDAAARPRGPVFQVTAQASGPLAMAGNARGSFAVSWTVAHRVLARLYRSDGEPAGPPVLVSPTSNSHPAVAMDATGRFLVVWARRPPAGAEFESWLILRRFFRASGEPEDIAFPLGRGGVAQSPQPAAAAGPAGDFLVVWIRDYATGGADIIGRRLAVP